MPRKKQNAKMSPNVLYAKKPKVIPSQSTSTDTTTEDYTSTLAESESKKTKIGTKDIFLNEIKGTDLFHNPTTKPQSLAEKRRNTSIVSFVPDKKVSKTKRLAAIKQMLKSTSNKNIYGIDAPDLKSKALLHNQYIRRSKYWLFKAPELQINFEKIAVKYCYWQYDNKGYQGIVQFVNRQKFTAVNTVLGKDIVFDWIDEIKNNGMKYLLKNEFELSWEYGTRPLEYEEFEKLEPKSYATHWDTYIRKKAEEKWMQQIMSIKPVSDDSGSFENDENENNVNNQQKCDSKKKKRTKKEKYLKEVNILSRLVLSGLSFTEIYLIEPVMARRHKEYVFELIKSETSAKAKKRLI